MKITYIFRFFILACSLVLFAACSGDDAAPYVAPTDPPPGDGTPIDPGTPVVPPTVSTAAPLALKISTMFDGTDFVVSHEFTETGTDTCEATAAMPTPTCTVVIPEGRLFFSELTFTYSWLPSNCRLMTFQPFYYQASDAAGYFDPTANSLEGDGTACDQPIPVERTCYGGAARFIVPEFPLKRALIYLPDEGGDATKPLIASSGLPSSFKSNYQTNRHSVNDLVDRTMSISAVTLGGSRDGYIAGSFVDYSLSCRDSWYDVETYRIDLRVYDENTEGGVIPGENHFPTFR